MKHRLFSGGEIGGDDDRGLLVEPADQVEEQLSAGLGEREMAELVQHHEVEPGEVVGEAALAAGARLGLELVDEVDHVKEAVSRAAADAGAGYATARWVLPVPVPPVSTRLRCWARKPPRARSRTRVVDRRAAEDETLRSPWPEAVWRWRSGI